MTVNFAQAPRSSVYDVLVIGSGAAGLYAALCLPERYRVGLISKESLALSASDWAQGGIAAAIAPDDSPQLHLEDTLKAGAGLCDGRAVQFLVEHAADCIQELVKLGVGFDRKDQHLALTLEAAHSRRRVLHAADTTGRAVVSTLAARVLERPNIQVLAERFVLGLWLHPQTQRCQGVSILDQGEIRWLKAGAVILATGGGGQVFAQTTNPSVSTGDGVAIAHQVGALLRDLEFFQFHPTALTWPGAPRFLISEAVRGEGAHLVDDQGDRFAFAYHPSGELAPRDVVSRAIFNHLQKTNQERVWLDLRPIGTQKIQARFPNIIEVCRSWGIDVFHELVPVAPAAHYWMGGIVTDTQSRTSIPGLYAVGETTSTGVHGANRLASNSLLECIVFGAQLAHLQLEPVTEAEIDLPVQQIRLEFLPSDEKWQQLQADLKQLMWQSAGICRTQTVLTEAIATVEAWQQDFYTDPLSEVLTNLKPGQTLRLSQELPQGVLRTWGETRNLLVIAHLILKSATFRTESRGGHFRLDFPQTALAWQVHTLIQHQTWQTAPVVEA